MQISQEQHRETRRPSFFNEQEGLPSSSFSVKLEEKNRRGKSKGLFRKTGNIKGTFCPKMGTIKDINRRDLVDSEETRRPGKNTQKNYIKNIQMNWMTAMVWSATQSQTFWSTKSNRS